MFRKKIVCTFVAITMVLSTCSVVLADPLSDQLKERQNQLQQDKNNLDQVQKQRESLESSIEMLDSQIEALLRDIDSTKKQMDNIQTQIKTAEKDIKKSEEDMKDEQELFNKRMRVMYMNGSDSYLEVLLKSKGIGDFFSRMESVKKIMDLDKKIITQLKSKKKSINDKKDALKSQNDKLSKLKADNEQKLAKINENKKSQSKLIADLKAQEKLYSSRLKESNALIEQTKRQIAALSASQGSPSKSTEPISSNAIVAYAAKFLGRPYKWAGNGPDVFDCSGFTKYVFANFGIEIPRVAEDQAKVGTAVSRDELQPGDLVFFGIRYIHHVGIYVGNNCYIHAPQTGDVIRISTLGRSDYAGARRVK